MLGDLGMCSEVLECCNLSVCSGGVWDNMYHLLLVFLMLRAEICWAILFEFVSDIVVIMSSDNQFEVHKNKQFDVWECLRIHLQYE